MTTPALMAFSNIEAINFYFNAKLTNFAICFHIISIFDLHTAQCIGITKRMVVCFSTFDGCRGNHPCTIACYLKRAGLLPLKGYLMFLTITNRFYLKKIILTSFSFRGVLTSRSNFTIVFLFKCTYLNNYTR